MAMTIDGTAGVTYPSGVVDSNASIGYTQTWTNVVGSRALGTTYTNSTGRPIFIVVVVGGGTVINCIATLTVSGITTIAYGTNSGTAGGASYPIVSALIPVGGTYSVQNANNATLQSWFELR